MKDKSRHIFMLRRAEIKFWLDPTQLASNYGFNIRELNEIERLVEQNETAFLEAWNEHFDQH